MAEKSMVRRKDRRRGKESANDSPAPMPQEGWFTVSDAAQILAVPVTKIFDSIRDGRLRVRFHVDKEGDAERPLVTSEELSRRSVAHSGIQSRPLPPVSRRIEDDAEASEGSEAGEAGAVKAASAVDSAGAVDEPVTRDLPADPPDRAPVRIEAPALHTTGNGNGSRDRVKPPGDVGEIPLALRLAEESLARERQLRRAAELKVDRVEQELRQLREKSEETRGAEGRRREAAEKEAALAKLAEARSEERSEQLQQELERLRASLEQTEDRMERSLEAVYERDVKVARLESELQAAGKIHSHGNDHAQRLLGQITRLEDRSEEKEKEIRRLALGLGEARGEIRMLRPPIDENSQRFRLGKRLLPWLLVLVGGAFAAWVTHELAASQQFLGAGLVAAVGMFAAHGFGQAQARLRRNP